MGSARGNPDRYDQGGLTEQQQGEGIVRMMKAVRREGYARGIIFEWADEWAKKTWTTEPFIIPFDRNPPWHNTVDPEQNYGMLAMETSRTKSLPYSLQGDGLVREMTLGVDESYLHIDLDLERPLDFSKEELALGLDTNARYQGDLCYSPDIPVAGPTGLEFIVEIDGEGEAQLGRRL